jgi:hypothetical protein
MKKKNTNTESAWIVTATITSAETGRESVSKVIVALNLHTPPNQTRTFYKEGFLMMEEPEDKNCRWLGHYFKHEEEDKVTLEVEPIDSCLAEHLNGTSLEPLNPEEITTGGYYLTLENAQLQWEWTRETDDLEGFYVAGPGDEEKSIASNLFEISNNDSDDAAALSVYREELRKLGLITAATHLELLEAAEQATSLLKKWKEAVGEGVCDNAPFLYEAYINNQKLLRWFLCHLLNTSTREHHDALMELATAAANDDHDYEVLIWAAQFEAYKPVAPFEEAELLYGNVGVVNNEVVVL